LTNVVPIQLAHFWSKVEIGGPAMCWIWTGARKGRDAEYGKFRDWSAHRYAYEMHRGPIPDGLMVRHMCGNKRCVNPDHLELGTAQDNFKDRYALGERTGGVGGRGESNPRSKISEADARYIYENPDKLTGSQLARKFSVSPATICLIRQGKRWAHVA
jgi:hypothetical protein